MPNVVYACFVWQNSKLGSPSYIFIIYLITASTSEEQLVLPRACSDKKIDVRLTSNIATTMRREVDRK